MKNKIEKHSDICKKLNNLYKKTEELLKNYNVIKAKIENLELDITEVKNFYEGPAAISYEEKTGPTNKFSSVVEEEIINRDFVLKKLEHELQHKKILIKKIDNAINTLNDTEKKVIENICIKNIPYKQVAQTLNIENNYCYMVKRKAIEKVSNLILIKEKNRI